MTKPQGALFFWKDEPHVTGYLIIGGERYELAGVRKNDIRTDFEVQPHGKQMEMFGDDSGDGTS